MRLEVIGGAAKFWAKKNAKFSLGVLRLLSES
jgi:hypothetical protein